MEYSHFEHPNCLLRVPQCQLRVKNYLLRPKKSLLCSLRQLLRTNQNHFTPKKYPLCLFDYPIEAKNVSYDLPNPNSRHKIVYYDLLNAYYDLQNDNYDFPNDNYVLENNKYHFPTPIYNCGNNNYCYQTASHKFATALYVGLITSNVLKIPFYTKRN